jgi:hypothetical protein
MLVVGRRAARGVVGGGWVPLTLEPAAVQKEAGVRGKGRRTASGRSRAAAPASKKEEEG